MGGAERVSAIKCGFPLFFPLPSVSLVWFFSLALEAPKVLCCAADLRGCALVCAGVSAEILEERAYAG